MPRVPRRPSRSTARTGPTLTKRRLDALVDEAIIDAYGESEQRVGLLTLMQERLACPFQTEILGTFVHVARVDLNEAEEIVAVCRRGRRRQLIPILNLPLPSPPPAGWEWIAAYGHWRAAAGSTLTRHHSVPLVSSRETAFVGRLLLAVFGAVNRVLQSCGAGVGSDAWPVCFNAVAQAPPGW